MPPREELVRKKVDFITLGPSRKMVASRTLSWLCNTCLERDEHYNLEPFKSSPGMKSEPLEQVRAARKAEGNAPS